MQSNKVIRLLEKANYISISEITAENPYKHILYRKTDLLKARFAVNLIRKEIILMAHSTKLPAYDEYVFYKTEYEPSDINKIYEQYQVKINTFTKEDSYWSKLQEAEKILYLIRYTNYFDHIYFKCPKDWIDIGALIEWLEELVQNNLPNKLIDVTDLHKDPMYSHDEIEGVYKIITEDREVSLLMRYDLTSFRAGKTWRIANSQKIIEIEPLFEHMKGWSMQRLREFCTKNNFKLIRVRCTNYSDKK